MDAIKYFEIKKRMTEGCKSSSCKTCPLSVQDNNVDQFCTDLELEYPEKVVEIVEKWAEEHPAKTRMSELLKKFPKAEVLKYGHDEYIDICPVSIDTTRTCPNGECKNCKLEYWNEEVENG